MPHIPRSMAPSGQIDFGAVPRAPKSSTKKATVPLKAPSSNRSTPKRPSGRGVKLVQKLSMRDWDVDPLRVLNHLTGKEITADEFSGVVSDA